MQVSCSLEVLGSQTGIPKGLEKKLEIPKEGYQFWNLEGLVGGGG